MCGEERRGEREDFFKKEIMGQRKWGIEENGEGVERNSPQKRRERARERENVRETADTMEIQNWRQRHGLVVW